MPMGSFFQSYKKKEKFLFIFFLKKKKHKTRVKINNNKIYTEKHKTQGKIL